MERGLDISGAQSPTSTLLIGLLKQPLYTFVIVKATEGQGLDIASYPKHRANVLAYGKRHAAYHFAWCNQDPILEAQHFVRYAALKPGEVGCLDLENWTTTAGVVSGTPWTTRIDYTLKWVREYRRLTGATAVLYMNWDWIKNFRTNSTAAQWASLCEYPLWLADYDSNAPGVFPTVNPQTPGGPTMTVWLHQWTASRPANDGGLDGDACMDPTLWSTYAIPEEEMSAADVAAIMAAITDVKKDVGTLTNKVEQKANIVDVKANSTAITALEEKVGEVNASVGLAQADVVARVDGLGDAVSEQVGTSVAAAVQDSLTGFSVHTTMQFPTN